ncbi:MAG: SdiA-regulated domain-containing protein [Chitinophagaceae bacterium]
MKILNFPVKWLATVLFLSFVFIGCREKRRILKSPPHYNFADVFTDKLDLRLKEISGLAWDSKGNHFLAINDESGKIFFLDKETKLISQEYTFGDKGDYEDVAILNGVPYILRSDGMITKFIKDDSGKAYGVEAGKIPLSGTNDFETMYADVNRKALVLICKNCKADDAKTVSAFAFYPDSLGFDSKPLFTIDAEKVNKLSPSKSSKFQPSAAAINPMLQKLFIISSASNQLVVADLSGKVESVHELSKKLFPQPEGIAFKQSGDMYITNEGLNTKSTMLKFVYTTGGDSTKAQLNNTGYDFSAPDEKMELRKQLKEISGMSYIAGKNLILTENDEKGNIFVVDFKNKNDDAGKITFGGKGDYEDIVHTDTAVYMLVSTGAVVRVMTKDSSFSTQEFIMVDGDDENEFEAMYLGADGNSLVLLCKDCDHEKDEIRAAYRFDLVTLTFSPRPLYTIEISEIRKILNDDKAEFKPSAAAINPLNGKLYIIASVGKLLVIASKAGKVEQVYQLDPTLYNQPEGLTFAPNGDLYISNEAGEVIATILKFSHKKN